MPGLDPLIFVSWESETASNQVEIFPVDLRDRVIELNFTDKSRGADEATLKMYNGDLALFDDPRLAEGNKLILQWGYVHDMRQPMEVTIKDIQGWSVLDIKCAGARDLDFTVSERTRTWENATIAEVAEEIAYELGFIQNDQKDIDEGDWSIRYEGITQAGETDYAFLQRLANSGDLVFRISGNKFHFHPPRLGDDPQVTLTYFDSDEGVFIGEPKLEKGTLGIPGQVRRRGHSTRDRGETDGEGSNTTDTNRVVVGEMILVPNPETHIWTRRPATRADVQRAQQAQSSTRPTSASSDAETEANARRNFRRGERQAIKMSFNIIGMPALRADSIIRIEGIGEKLTGNYYIEEISHKIGGGYSCSLKVKRNAQSGSSAGRQRGRQDRNRALQQLDREKSEANAQLASGQITADQHNRLIQGINNRRKRISNSASGRASGRVNNNESPDQEQLVPQVYRDSENNQWRTRWTQSSEASSSNNRTGGGS